METVRAETTTACLSAPLLLGKSIWIYKYYLHCINSSWYYPLPPLPEGFHSKEPHPETLQTDLGVCVCLVLPSVQCESVVCIGALKVKEKQSLYLFIDLLSSNEERKWEWRKEETKYKIRHYFQKHWTQQKI